MERKIESIWQDWKVTRKIGVGGFGAVYEIERDVFGNIEKSALKVISIPTNDNEIKELYEDGYDSKSITEHFQKSLESFVKEYTLMVGMKGHPNVVYCDDIKYVKHEDNIGWDVFIKMELLTPLVSTVPNEYSEKTAVKLAKDICNALCYCKKKNIIHRDIKPRNIFVSDIGDYKLGDFGVAKATSGTQCGTKLGTIDYIAPEVYSGKPYGGAADIYSLGMTLYWLANNKRIPCLPTDKTIPSYDDKTNANFRRLSGEKIPEPINGSDEFKRIILKACAFEPSERYSSPEEMLKDLEAIDLEPPIAEPSVNNEVIESTNENAKVTEEDKTVAIFEVPTQPEISKKNEGSDKTEVLKKEEPKVEPKVEPKAEPKKETTIDYKEFIQNNEHDTKKPKKTTHKKTVFVVLGILVVAIIVSLLIWRPWDTREGALEDTLEDALYNISFDNVSTLEHKYEDGICIHCDELQTKGLKYTLLDNGTYEVSGIGSCTDTDIHIPKRYNGRAVTKIGEGAFEDCGDLTSVIIPDSIVSIGDFAFGGCSNLTFITIPDSVTKIGVKAFEDCYALTTITIPDSVTVIASLTFDGAGLTSITIPKSVTKIMNEAFDGCPLTSVTFEDPIGWKIIDHEGNIVKDSIDVSLPSKNAEYLCSRYSDEFFMKRT